MGAGRNALAAIGVLAGLAALVAGPAAIDVGLPDVGPLPAGGTLDVGYGVSLRPPPGARQDLGASRPGAGEVVLLVAGVRVRVTAVEVPERPDDFVAHARHKFARDEGLRPGPAQPARTTAGVSGEQGDLRGTDGGRSACYAIFTADALGAVAMVSPVDGCAAVPEQVRAAITSLTFDRPEWP